MNRGARAAGSRPAAWLNADSGELMLRSRFDPNCKVWEFIACPTPDHSNIELTVRQSGEIVLTLVEPTEFFVSELTLTKIIMICGDGEK